MTRCVTRVSEWEESPPSALRLLRQSARVSQRQAARHVGITPQLLYAHEQGLAEVPQAVIDKLTAFYAKERAPLIVCAGCGHLAKAGAPCVHCRHA
jgi:DNA-binding XRE family transcriptional regulator